MRAPPERPTTMRTSPSTAVRRARLARNGIARDRRHGENKRGCARRTQWWTRAARPQVASGHQGGRTHDDVCGVAARAPARASPQRSRLRGAVAHAVTCRTSPPSSTLPFTDARATPAPTHTTNAGAPRGTDPRRGTGPVSYSSLMASTHIRMSAPLHRRSERCATRRAGARADRRRDGPARPGRGRPPRPGPVGRRRQLPDALRPWNWSNATATRIRAPMMICR